MSAVKCRSRQRWWPPIHPIATEQRFAGAPTTNTDGACDLLVIILPNSHNGGPMTGVQTGLLHSFMGNTPRTDQPLVEIQ
ncbi:hypothetical protein B1987_07790 [Mycobacterium kansasii]|nr:hypothetical protein B1987_07790 [Mycobacterium kansasii]